MTRRRSSFAIRAIAPRTAQLWDQVRLVGARPARARRDEGRPRRHLVAQPLRVGGRAVRDRAHRRDPRQHQPRLPDHRAASTRCSSPASRSSSSRARSARPTTSACSPRSGPLPGPARGARARGRLGGAAARRRRTSPPDALRSGREHAAVRRPDQHPVHVGHDRLPEGRDALAPQHPQQRLLHRRDAASTRRDDRVCIPVPFYHCFGMVLGNLACTTHGACMVIPGEAFDPQPRSMRVTAGGTLHVALRRADDVHRRARASALRRRSTSRTLRTGIMAGSPCPVEVMKQGADRACTCAR